MNINSISSATPSIFTEPLQSTQVSYKIWGSIQILLKLSGF
jgi:hypothetical protein